MTESHYTAIVPGLELTDDDEDIEAKILCKIMQPSQTILLHQGSEDSSSSESSTDSDKVHVEYFDEGRSLKQRLQLLLLQNRRASLCLRLFNVLTKLFACLLYVIRVFQDNNFQSAACYNCTRYNLLLNFSLVDEEDFLHCPLGINYNALLWVDRSRVLWNIQVLTALVSFLQTIFFCYITFKGKFVQLLLSRVIILELFIDVPFFATLYPSWRNLFIPAFLNCWLAKMFLQDLLNAFNRTTQRSQSAFGQQMIKLISTTFCLIFTSTCAIQHLQRAGRQQLTLFQSFYFVVVTLSTVGFGDLYPDIWVSQLCVVIMICVAFVVLPSQLEQLAYLWMERQKSGGEYSKHRAKSEKHVVVCLTCLRADTVSDFLHEFYADPLHSDYFVVLLSPCELDNTTRMVVRSPAWSQRVIYIKGSALRANDLERARMMDAKGCFILASRNYADKNAADQHAILRSWAVKDYAPSCKQFVQIFRPENKMHVKHAESVVCEDEFKYALLANNCICPGISTFITLLLHTSRGEEGQHSSETWHKLYGRHSGNEIYHIQLSLSKIFCEFEGKSFTYASFHAHKKYSVALIAVQAAKPGSTLQLNPGPRHIMKGTDVCYYMSITREEQMTIVAKAKLQTRSSTSRLANSIAGIGTVALEVQQTRADGKQPVEPPKPESNYLRSSEHSVSRRPSIAAVPDVFREEPDSERSVTEHLAMTMELAAVCEKCNGPCKLEEEYTKGFPPVTPYIGTSATLCYLNKEKKRLCCLQLAESCQHCSHSNVKSYGWDNPAIILAADHASNGIYNFIIPLRAHYRPAHSLNPILLLLERTPNATYLDAISWFPMIYWMSGNIENIDHVLRAGIHVAEHVVVVNKETSNSQEDDYLADCNTIVAVQTMYRLFPSVRIITELTHSSNMRFMQFNAKDLYALHQSQIEKKEKERGSCMAYMFRLPFAAGNVFSATMLDTLLYQTFSKEYLIQFARLLLGIDQSFGSGHLTAIKIGEDELWIRTYGRLYQKLCSTEGDIPIGLFRTQIADTSVLSSRDTAATLDDLADIWKRKYTSKYLVSERHEIANLVRCRMISLGLSVEDYAYLTEKRNHISYVIINPSFDLKLELDDIVYVLRPHKPVSKQSPLGTKSQLAFHSDGYNRHRRSRNSTPRGQSRRGGNTPRVTITLSTPNENASSQDRVTTVNESTNNGRCPVVCFDEDLQSDDAKSNRSEVTLA